MDGNSFDSSILRRRRRRRDNRFSTPIIGSFNPGDSNIRQSVLATNFLSFFFIKKRYEKKKVILRILYVKKKKDYNYLVITKVLLDPSF